MTPNTVGQSVIANSGENAEDSSFASLCSSPALVDALIAQSGSGFKTFGLRERPLRPTSGLGRVLH